MTAEDLLGVLEEQERDRAADLARGRELADEGASRALNADDDPLAAWRVRAQARLKALADSGATFTADDVTDQAGEPPSPNAMGGLFRANRSSLVAVGYTQTTRQAGHARVIRVWRAAWAR